nr:GNAT family N-acetyltransferase [Bacteroidota bacterium]
MNEQKVIDPVPGELILAELNATTFLRKTNNGNNEIYVVNHRNAPNTLREIGRLREVTFRAAGGGTGLACDLDEYDTNEQPYQQLIVWNTTDKDIVGGYRYIHCKNAIGPNGEIMLSTSELFNFSGMFIRDYMPYTIELGRSFVQPKYQPTATNRTGLFSLDNLWDGLGAIIVDNEDLKYYWGKVTMYLDFNRQARDMILYFMNYIFPDSEKLVTPIIPLKYETDIGAFAKEIEGLSYKEAHVILNHHVRSLKENIPPLVNSYMNISPTMKTFGTALNSHFGDVEETGILVTIADIYDSKKERHVNTYQKKS